MFNAIPHINDNLDFMAATGRAVKGPCVNYLSEVLTLYILKYEYALALFMIRGTQNIQFNIINIISADDNTRSQVLSTHGIDLDLFCICHANTEILKSAKFCWDHFSTRFWARSLQWRNNGRDGVSNHQPQDCLLDRLFGRRSKKTWKLRVTSLCVGNSPGTGEFPAQRASNADNLFIWWRHHRYSDRYWLRLGFRSYCITFLSCLAGSIYRLIIGIPPQAERYDIKPERLLKSNASDARDQTLVNTVYGWCCNIRYPSDMMTSSNGNIFRVTGPLCGEFTGPGEFPTQRPVTRSFDVFFDLLLNKRLSKQPWGWWFETLSWSLWRHCNESVWNSNLVSSRFSISSMSVI